MERRPARGAADTPGFWRDVLITAGVLLLPSAIPVAGGLIFFVPLAVLLLCGRQGIVAGARITGTAAVAAGTVALLLGQGNGFLLTSTFVLAGLVMGWAAAAGLPPPRVGAWGLGVLAGGWLLFWGSIALISGHNPYTELVRAIDQGMTAAFPAYLEQIGVPQETRPELEAAFARSRAMLPVLLPGVILSSLAGCVWTVLVLFHWLAARSTAIRLAWPPYRLWRLPEGLVWAGIALGFGVLLGPTKPIAVAGLFFLGVLYFFQGLAVLACLLERWQLPTLLRITAYAVILLQAYGMILLAILGLVDVWADFGRLNRPSGGLGTKG